MSRKILVTGGSGFLGAGLVEALVRQGHEVTVLDNNFRGHLGRLAEVGNDVRFIEADIRDADAVGEATRGQAWVFHLAFINGTRHFYERPDLVLDVGVRGALTTMDAARRHGVERYIVASSSEVYQEPSRIPTDETERLVIPDVTNPRFSYAGGKLITELLALHYLSETDCHRILFRPHNVYGPDMGWEHVIPEIIRRIHDLRGAASEGRLSLPIQGSGRETRAFCYIDDAVEGILLAAERGENGEIFHVGVEEEVEMADVIRRLGRIAGLELDLQPRELRTGSTPRRCPDITKLRALGFRPSVSLDEGLAHCWRWYSEALETQSRKA